MKMLRLLFLLAALACAPLALAACGDASSSSGSNDDPDTLRVALLPDENASAVIEKNQGLKSYLERTLDKKIELVVTTDYSSMIEAMRRGRIELGYFGPLSYVLASQRADIEPFAALMNADGNPTYQSILIGSVKDGITSVAQARGKDVAFGDPASTSSHLIPRELLAEAGLQDGTDYTSHFVGAHDAVALTVQNGKAAVGGLSKPIFEELVDQDVIDPSKVRVLATSQEYTNYPWTMQSSLAPALKAKIRDAFLNVRDPAVLDPFGGTGFAPVGPEDYDYITTLAEKVGLNLADTLQ